MRVTKQDVETQFKACKYALDNKDIPENDRFNIEILMQHIEGKLKEMELTGQKHFYMYGRDAV